MAKLGNWDAYLTLHTYGQWIFTPWGYTKLLPADYRDLHEKAEIGRNAILKISGILILKNFHQIIIVF